MTAKVSGYVANPMESIFRRDWVEIVELWLRYIPVDNKPGLPPPSPASSLPSLIEEVEGLKGRKDIPENVPGLRKTIIQEAFFYLQRSAYLLSGAEVHVAHGLPSWSLSSAYHSAFFCAKGILGLLGIIWIDIAGKNLLIDSWSTLEYKTGKPVKADYVNVMIVETYRPDQRNIWELFQRVLRTVRIDEELLSDNIKRTLKQLTPKDFSRKRNDIHYRSCRWPFADVSGSLSDKTWMMGISDNMLGRPDTKEFPIILAVSLIRMACHMLTDMATFSKTVDGEIAVVNRWLLKNSAYSKQSMRA